MDKHIYTNKLSKLSKTSCHLVSDIKKPVINNMYCLKCCFNCPRVVSENSLPLDVVTNRIYNLITSIN